jgi:hypothetical protein
MLCALLATLGSLAILASVATQFSLHLKHPHN